MSTRFYMTTGETDQEHFYQRFEIERNITLQLAGMTEEDLTSDQRSALDAYVAAQKSFYLAEWGISGPGGNVLRMESDLESVTRLAWEEAIKPAWMKLKERVEMATLQYWCDYVDRSMKGVRVAWIEDVSDQGEYTVQLRYHDYDQFISDIGAYVVLLLSPAGDLSVTSCLSRVPCDGERDSDDE